MKKLNEKKSTITVTRNAQINEEIELEPGDKIIVLSQQESVYMPGSGTFTQVDDQGRVWEKISQDGSTKWISKIDMSHFYMTYDIDRGKSSFHVREFPDDPNFQQELKAWLRGKESIGGKVFD